MVLGLEAVLPDGTALKRSLKTTPDTTSNNFLSVQRERWESSRVTFRLLEKPSSRSSAIVALSEYKNVVALLKFLEKGLGGTLSGFELMWQRTYQAMTQPPSTYSPPLPPSYPYYVFVESLGSNRQTDFEQLTLLIEDALEKEIILDGVMAQTERELQNIWRIREDVSVLADQSPYDQHFDISLPIGVIGQEVNHAIEALEKLPFVSSIFLSDMWPMETFISLLVKKTSKEIIEAINSIIYANLKHGSVS